MEKQFDFAKPEDQEAFEALPEAERDVAINEAHEEAKEMDEKGENDVRESGDCTD